MKHKWKGQQQGGNPSDIGSYEWICWCDNCGVESDDDNEHEECTVMPSLTEELSCLYKLELNCSLTSFWDGGWTFKLGDPTNGFQESHCFDTLDEVAQFVWEINQTIFAQIEEQETEYRQSR